MSKLSVPQSGCRNRCQSATLPAGRIGISFLGDCTMERKDQPLPRFAILKFTTKETAFTRKSPARGTEDGGIGRPRCRWTSPAIAE